MRVLHVVGALDPYIGGSTAAAIDTCGHLRRRGVDAVLAGTWDSSASADHISERWPELPVHGFSRRAPRHYWNSPALRQWLRTETGGFDLVCTHVVFKFPFVHAARAARARHVPYIVQTHGSLDPYDLQKHRPQKALFGPLVVRPLLETAGAVLVTTRREGDRLVTWGASPPVHVVALPVTRPVDKGDGAAFRVAHDIPVGAPIVLFLSRLHRKKGIDRLFQAVALLRQQHPDIVLVLAGSGPPDYERALRQKAETATAGARVVWLGLVTGAAKWNAFAAADVFALPSDNENFGIAVLEAALARTPAVVSDEVYLADDLAGAGVTVCPSDPGSFATAIGAVLRDPERATQQARETQEFVCRHFDPDAVAQSTLHVYEAVIGRHLTQNAHD